MQTDSQWVPSDRTGEAERVTLSQDARRRNNSHHGCNCGETKREVDGWINEDRCVREGKIENKNGKNGASIRKDRNYQEGKNTVREQRGGMREREKVAGGRGL